MAHFAYFFFFLSGARAGQRDSRSQWHAACWQDARAGGGSAEELGQSRQALGSQKKKVKKSSNFPFILAPAFLLAGEAE